MITIEEFLSKTEKEIEEYLYLYNLERNAVVVKSYNFFSILNIVPDIRAMGWMTIDRELIITYDPNSIIPGDTNTTTGIPIAENLVDIRFVYERGKWNWTGKKCKFMIYDEGIYKVTYTRRNGEKPFKTPLDYIKWIRERTTTLYPICKEFIESLKKRPIPMMERLTEESVNRFIDPAKVREALENYFYYDLKDKKYLYLFLIYNRSGISSPLVSDLIDKGFPLSASRVPKEELDRLETFLQMRIPRISEIMTEAETELKNIVRRELNNVINKYGLAKLDFEVTINGDEI